jgi:DNA-binding NarL/FixJ family response regulator
MRVSAVYNVRFSGACTAKVVIMKILIVDDHLVVREGISALLQRDALDTAILQAGSAKEALELIKAHEDFDVIVLDLMLPDMNGLEAITEFAKIRPELPVIVISSSEDPRDARKAFAQGALGYVPKSSSRHVLISAVELVINGDLYVPKLLLEDGSTPVAATPALYGEEGLSLTPRQIDVLQRIGEGLPNKTIANELGLSEKTVKVHITAIFKVLKVVNRTQSVTAGRKAGLI